MREFRKVEKKREMSRGVRCCMVHISCVTLSKRKKVKTASIVKYKMSACFCHTNHISCIFSVVTE